MPVPPLLQAALMVTWLVLEPKALVANTVTTCDVQGVGRGFPLRPSAPGKNSNELIIFQTYENKGHENLSTRKHVLFFHYRTTDAKIASKTFLNETKFIKLDDLKK